MNTATKNNPLNLTLKVHHGIASNYFTNITCNYLSSNVSAKVIFFYTLTLTWLFVFAQLFLLLKKCSAFVWSAYPNPLASQGVFNFLSSQSLPLPGPRMEMSSLSFDGLIHFICVSVLSFYFYVVLCINLDNIWSCVFSLACLCFFM